MEEGSGIRKGSERLYAANGCSEMKHVDKSSKILIRP